MEVYKLRCSIFGHEKDVRGVCASEFPENGIISGSRDVTTRIWTPLGENNSFMEGNVMGGHSRFISCVCVTPPDAQYPHGLIMTGSHDHTINAYTLDSPEPLFKLDEHTDTVCSLACGKFGSLISGSWDKTAKVWLNRKCVMTLQGHEAAVWAVAIMPEGGFMLTASADKAIKLWKAGKCEHTFTGHTDCVRGLAVLTATDFLSCSNDATVKRWRTTGQCVQTLYGHSNFVYSIAAFPNSENFVTTSEDRSLRVWKNGECKQTIFHPCTSVWSVCILPNGDLVTGGSDGTIRVFTCAAERMADEETLKAYEEQLSASTITTQIGDIKTNELPTTAVLLTPGKKDGQTVMVRNGDNIEAHNWNAAGGKWEKIGDVVGGSGGSQASSGKQLYEGKEFDYVFEVELDVEGLPTKLKLPFNAGEDPWMAAHKFLDNNEISQMYLDQVAKFIMDQTKGVSLQQSTPSVSDPFTGAGRYVPGSSVNQTAAAPTASSDPLTGGGRYVPSYNSSNTSASTGGGDPINGGGSKNPYFPIEKHLLFDSANTTAILGKLKELNLKACDPLDVDCVDEMEGLMSGAKVDAERLRNLWSLLQWPGDIAFPAIDVLRLSIRHQPINHHFCNSKDGPEFMRHVLKFLSNAQPAANQMLAVRTLANVFSHASGEQLMKSYKDEIVPAVIAASTGTFNKNIQVACASLMLNYAVTYRGSDDVETKCQLLSGCGEISGRLSEAEAHFRLLVCIGTLLDNDANCAEIAKSMEMQLYTNKCAAIFEPKKVSECADLLAKKL